MAVRVDLIESNETFRALGREWNDLLGESASDSVFLTWEWISTWWDCFGGSDQPWVLTARDKVSGKLVGLAPLVSHGASWRNGPYRRLGFMGAGHACGDHLDFVIRRGYEREVLDGFARRFRLPPCDLVDFEGVSESSASVFELLNTTASSTHGLSRTACPYVRLPSTWKKFVASLPRKMRYNLRSRARRLCSISNGEVNYWTVDDVGDIDGALSALLELMRFAGHRGTTRTRSDRQASAEFHRRIARLFLQRGWLRLHVLSAGDRPIAVSYCFLYRGKLSFFQTGFDRRWARFGPGAAIVAHSIREAIRDGANEFDFLRGSEPYKFQWASGVRHIVRVRIAHSVRGKMSLSTRRIAKELVGHLIGRPSRPRQVAVTYRVDACGGT